MKLHEFLSENKIKLESDLLNLCEDGINIMRESIDDSHNHNHVYRLFDFAHNLINAEGEDVSEKLNFDIFVPAICWHDTWKAGRFTNDSLKVFIFDQYWDGLGSARKFSKHIKTYYPTMDAKLYKEIKYSVRQHGGLSKSLFGVKNIETKVLCDIDTLDLWSMKRIKSMADKYLNHEHVNKRSRGIVRYYVKKYLKVDDDKFHFDWSKSEYLKKIKPILNEVEKILQKIDEIILEKEENNFEL